MFKALVAMVPLLVVGCATERYTTEERQRILTERESATRRLHESVETECQKYAAGSKDSPESIGHAIVLAVKPQIDDVLSAREAAFWLDIRPGNRYANEMIGPAMADLRRDIKDGIYRTAVGRIVQIRSGQ